MTTTMRLIDITRPVGPGIAVWPGDTPFELRWTLSRADGASVNLSELRLSAHTGTHADAPYHVDDEGARIGEVGLDAYVGPARVVDARGWDSIAADRLEAMLAQPPERVLFRTGCWLRATEFPAAFPHVEPEAARRLVDAGVRLIGTDAPSVDPVDSRELPTHRLLRRAGVPNLENLWLDEVVPGEYELIALPLRLEQACASPVRAVLRAP